MEILALIIMALFFIFCQEYILIKYLFHKLDYSCKFSVDKACEGDDIFFEEVIHNRKFIPVPWIKAEIYTSRWLEFANKDVVTAQESRFITSNFYLRSYQKTTRRWKVKCLKRGVYDIDKVTLVGGDLLGIFSSISSVLSTKAELLVYPATIRLERSFIPASLTLGDTIVKRWIIDDPFIFAGTRQYNPGDSLNRIHWKATAKQGSLMVRKNDFTTHLRVAIILNIQSQDIEPDDVIYKEYIEFGIKVAATILERTKQEGLSVRFASNGGTVGGSENVIFTGEANSKEHVNDLLEIISRLKLRKNQEFESFLEEVSLHYENTEVIILTSYLTEKICEIISKIKRVNNSVSIIGLNAISISDSLKGYEGLDIYIPRFNQGDWYK